MVDDGVTRGADDFRVWMDTAHAARGRVGQHEVATLGVRVDKVRPARHRHGVEAVAAAHGEPVVFQDAGRVKRVARAAPVAIILQAAADPVRVLVVDVDLIELRQRHVVDDVEVLTCVVRYLVAAVASAQDVAAVFRVDPEGLVVAMDSLSDPLERLSAVGCFEQAARQRVRHLGVIRVDVDVGVVERSKVDVRFVVHHPPAIPSII